ncbi:hypothetical protein B0H13DRAFT_2360102 [Mycena leptocephala]|nr:hypothetical protein B0H13DRAFT_2360102 [Mycena leptocephala]
MFTTRSRREHNKAQAREKQVLASGALDDGYPHHNTHPLELRDLTEGLSISSSPSPVVIIVLFRFQALSPSNPPALPPSLAIIISAKRTAKAPMGRFVDVVLSIMISVATAGLKGYLLPTGLLGSLLGLEIRNGLDVDQTDATLLREGPLFVVFVHPLQLISEQASPKFDEILVRKNEQVSSRAHTQRKHAPICITIWFVVQQGYLRRRCWDLNGETTAPASSYAFTVQLTQHKLHRQGILVVLSMMASDRREDKGVPRPDYLQTKKPVLASGKDWL